MAGSNWNGLVACYRADGSVSVSWFTADVDLGYKRFDSWADFATWIAGSPLCPTLTPPPAPSKPTK